MKLLHTADWHLGKHLEGHSRIEEQKEFLSELKEIVEKKEVDLILISGDIYDTFNPPAEAEVLFYKSLKELSAKGERIICIIAGNHDSPQRLMAAHPLARSQGIIILGAPNSSVTSGKIGKHQIINSGQGFLELQINDEKIILLTLAYPSESRLNQVLTSSNQERDLQESYSSKVGDIFRELRKNYREDTINIAMSHIFVAGGLSSNSERPIQVGGGMTVSTEHLPSQSQYTALGHLHRCQVASKNKNGYYAGSPLQYSKSEVGYSKSVSLVELKAGKDAIITEIPLKNRKPIEEWEVIGIKEALAKCEENKERLVWVYLKIKTDRALLQSEIKQLKELKPDILSITPILQGQEEFEKEIAATEEKDIMDLFQEFYVKSKEVKPQKEVLKMFAQIINS